MSTCAAFWKCSVGPSDGFSLPQANIVFASLIFALSLFPPFLWMPLFSRIVGHSEIDENLQPAVAKLLAIPRAPACWFLFVSCLWAGFTLLAIDDSYLHGTTHVIDSAVWHILVVSTGWFAYAVLSLVQQGVHLVYGPDRSICRPLAWQQQLNMRRKKRSPDQLCNAAWGTTGENDSSWVQRVLQYAVDPLVQVSRVVVIVLTLLVFLGFDVTMLCSLLALCAILILSPIVYSLSCQAASLVAVRSTSPFNIGELVEMGGCLGFVEKITLRYVTLRQLDMTQAAVPVSNITFGLVKNLSRRPHKLVALSFSCAASTPVDKIVRLREDLQRLLQSSAVRQDMQKKAVLSGMSCGFDFTVQFYVAGVNAKGQEQSRSKAQDNMILAIMSSVHRHGIQLSAGAPVTMCSLPQMTKDITQFPDHGRIESIVQQATENVGGVMAALSGKPVADSAIPPHQYADEAKYRELEKRDAGLIQGYGWTMLKFASKSAQDDGDDEDKGVAPSLVLKSLASPAAFSDATRMRRLSNAAVAEGKLSNDVVLSMHAVRQGKQTFSQKLYSRFTSFHMPREVTVQHKHVGTCYRIMQIAVLLYIVIGIIGGTEWLHRVTPTLLAVTWTDDANFGLNRPAKLPSYCDNPAMNFAYDASWEAYNMSCAFLPWWAIFPRLTQEAFVATFIRELTVDQPLNCTEEFYKCIPTSTAFVYDPESLVITLQYQYFTTIGYNGQNPVTYFPKQGVMREDYPPSQPGEVMKVPLYIWLQAAGVESLDDENPDIEGETPDARHPSYRITGVPIVVSLTFSQENGTLGFNQDPVVNIQVTRGKTWSPYFTSPWDGNRNDPTGSINWKDTFGVRMWFVSAGNLGTPSLSVLISSFVASAVLLKGAKVAAVFLAEMWPGEFGALVAYQSRRKLDANGTVKMSKRVFNAFLRRAPAKVFEVDAQVDKNLVEATNWK